MKNDKTLILCSCDSSITYAPEAFKSQGFDNVVCTDQLCGSDLDVAVAALTELDQVVLMAELAAARVTIVKVSPGRLFPKDPPTASYRLVQTEFEPAVPSFQRVPSGPFWS